MIKAGQRMLLATLLAAWGVTSGRSSEFQGIGGYVGSEEYSEAYAVNATGDTVVGTSYLVGGTQAFQWSATTGTQHIDNMRQGRGLSGDGNVVVGDGLNPNTGVVEPVRWTLSGGVQLLGGPPGATLDYFTTAYDASYDGTVVAGQTKVNSDFLAFRWTLSDGIALLNFESPGDHSGAAAVSDDGSVIVGVWFRSGMSDVGFRWTIDNGVTTIDSPFGGLDARSTAIDVSADGSVVVGEAEVSPLWQAYRWTEHTGMTLLNNTLGGTSTAYGVTQSGEAIVGTAGVHAFVWTENRGMELLETVLRDRYGLGSEIAGWELYEARDISANGRTIVGSGVNPDGHYQAWVVRLDHPIFVPEPSAIALTLLAAAIFGSRKDRTQSRS